MSRLNALPEPTRGEIRHALIFLTMAAADDLAMAVGAHKRHEKGGSLANITKAQERVVALSNETRLWIGGTDES